MSRGAPSTGASRSRATGAGRGRSVAPGPHGRKRRRPELCSPGGIGPINQPMPAERRRVVLVVEDDLGVRRPLEKFLEIHEFKVVTADAADEAIDAIRHYRPAAAVVDLRLTRGSGRDVIMAMAPERPGHHLLGCSLGRRGPGAAPTADAPHRQAVFARPARRDAGGHARERGHTPAGPDLISRFRRGRRSSDTRPRRRVDYRRR